MPASLDEIIQQTRQRIAGPELPQDDCEWPPVLYPTANAQHIEAAEKELGFALPPLLKRIYTEVANGGQGFGPAYGIAGVNGHGTDERKRDIVTLFREQSSAGWKKDYPKWPPQMLRLAYLGCGMYSTLDCSSADTPLYIYEPNGGPYPDDEDVMFANCLFSYGTTFNEWWMDWAQGKDVQLPPDMREEELTDEEIELLEADE